MLAKHQGQGANITVSTGQSLNSWALRVHGVKAQLRYKVTTKSTGHTVQCTLYSVHQRGPACQMIMQPKTNATNEGLLKGQKY